MNYRIALLMLLCCSLFLQYGCESRKESDTSNNNQVKPTVQAVQAAPKHPYTDPIEPILYELPSGALATWRQFEASKPTLILFSAHPFLDPLTEEARPDLHKLIMEGPDLEIIRQGSLLNSNTSFLPPQTLSIAIYAGLFSKIVYVMPTVVDQEKLSLPNFQKRMLAYGFMTEDEAMALVIEKGVISGTVRNIPFLCVHPNALPEITTPAIIHIDLSYFKDLYINEIKTPVYELIYQLATSIRLRNYSVLAATLSYSNQEAGLALDSRFMLSSVADILRNPTLLEGSTPPVWQTRANALYASAMFSEDKAQELTEVAANEAPDDPAALYALAMLQFRRGQADQAFATLERTVAIDGGYAAEYSELATRGAELGQWKKVIELLYLAVKNLPDNDMVKVRLADMLIQRGRVKEARPIINQLMKLQWSTHYHKWMPDRIKEMATAVADDTIVPLPDEPPMTSPENYPRQMPPSHMGTPPRRN